MCYIVGNASGLDYLTWQNAEKKCQRLGNGGHLVSIANQEELKFVSFLLKWVPGSVNTVLISRSVLCINLIFSFRSLISKKFRSTSSVVGPEMQSSINLFPICEQVFCVWKGSNPEEDLITAMCFSQNVFGHVLTTVYITNFYVIISREVGTDWPEKQGLYKETSVWWWRSKMGV